MKSRIALICALLILAASLVSAQMTGATYTNTGGGGIRGSASFGEPPPFARQVITGAAYSGEEITERVQTLADGTHITETHVQRKVYRDAEGRVRTERPLMMGNPMTNSKLESPIVIEITDPVGGFRYVLDTQNRVAHRQVLPALTGRQMGAPRPSLALQPDGGTPMMGGMGGVMGGIIGSVPSAAPPPPPPPSGAPQAIATRPLAPGDMPAPARASAARSGEFSAMLAPPAGSNADGQIRPKFSTESLGTQTIDGVLVEGTRSTVTYPVGMMGNDREFSTTTESWTSPELKLSVLSKSNDPRTGQNTFRIANLSRTPPDPALFLAPSDYTIVDEKGGFTIAYGQQ
ncbi:MAG: hypothetical protein LAQ69_21440 [Acidobacteriia bacterium]|nr:hypothetical protein [Terriglobia bacterium]